MRCCRLLGALRSTSCQGPPSIRRRSRPRCGPMGARSPTEVPWKSVTRLDAVASATRSEPPRAAATATLDQPPAGATTAGELESRTVSRTGRVPLVVPLPRSSVARTLTRCGCPGATETRAWFMALSSFRQRRVPRRCCAVTCATWLQASWTLQDTTAGTRPPASSGLSPPRMRATRPLTLGPLRSTSRSRVRPPAGLPPEPEASTVTECEPWSPATGNVRRRRAPSPASPSRLTPGRSNTADPTLAGRSATESSNGPA